LTEKEKEELEKNNTSFVIRMKIPNKNIIFEDLVYGKMLFDSNTIDDQVLLKSDGFPTYHLANGFFFFINIK
jgi:glutamyl/glutaminyl-tRNA synthetase